MQPAVFDDGQTLALTHYHVDACFWKGDTFIDGATFLVPSRLPEAGLGCYSVDLDDTTGVHHVTLQTASLRTTLPLTNLSNPGFSSHVVEFSNGKMIPVPRVNSAATGSKRKARKTPSRESQWDSSVAQRRLVRGIVRQIRFGTFGQNDVVDEFEPVRDHVADNQPRFTSPPVSASHNGISRGTNSALAGVTSSTNGSTPVSDQVANCHTSHSASSGFLLRKLFPNLIVATSRAPDHSITGSGRVVGQQAADDRSSLSNFSESIIHLVPRNATASTSIEAEGSDAVAQAQEPVETAVDIQTSDKFSISRRSSAESQGSRNSTSTVPTSPASSTFSTLPFWKSALEYLPQVPVAPGKPTDVIKALALEEPQHDEPEKADGPDKTVVRRLSWGLRISYRQLNHWDEIQDGQSPCREEVSAPRNGLAMTKEGQIIVAEEASNNVQSVVTSPEQTSKPVEALSSFFSDETCLPQLFDALDVVRIELVGQKCSRLFPLDLVPEAKGKQCATNSPKSQQFPPVGDETDVEIAIDSTSGKLYLRPKIAGPAVVIQSIPAVTGTNGTTEVSVPAQDHPSSDNPGQLIRLEDIDLTAEFNQGATDLDDEEMYSVPSTIDYHVIGSRLAKTRYIPSDYADYVEHIVQTQPFIPRIVVEANEYWNFLKANIDGTWYAQGCPKGFLLRRSFCENDSDAVFRELLGLGSKPKALVEAPRDLRVGFPVHHYNLINQPVFQDSRNSSAVSYWAAMASYWKEPIEDGASWKAVVSSQAAKWVDPCTLDPGVEIPDDLRTREKSTALRDFFTGQTTIQYEPLGTWIYDRYDPDQEVPEIMSARFREAMLNASSAANLFHGLQRPHLIRPEEGAINVNDDGTATVYPSEELKKRKDWETLESRGFTNLRLVDDGTRRVYSFKGMEESRVCEILDKYETAGILVVDLPFKAEPENSVEEISTEADADEIEDDSSEAETDVHDEFVFEREPVHYQGPLLITEGSAAADSSEGAPKQVNSFGSENNSQNSAVVTKEAGADHGPITQANTCTCLVVYESPTIEKAVEKLEEPKVKGLAKIKLLKLPEYLADIALDVGKDLMDDVKTQSYEDVSNNDEEDEDSDHGSVPGVGYDDTDYSSTWPKRPKPDEHPKANDLASFADVVRRLLAKSSNSSEESEVVSKSEQSQKGGSGQEAEVISQSKQDETDLDLVPQAKSDEVVISHLEDVDNTMSGQGSTPSTTSSTKNRESLILSGRNLSAMKMLSSSIDQPGTPPQSPEAAENFGVWEDDGNGGFESPGKHQPLYMARGVNGQGDQFDDDVNIFDSRTEESPAAAQKRFFQALALPNAKAESTVAYRVSKFQDEEAFSTPVKAKVGVLSPIRENSQTPIQKIRALTGPRVPWNPDFMGDGSRTRLPGRKQTLSLAAGLQSETRAAAKLPSGESSMTHSRNTSSSSEAISTANGSTHTRNTSVSNTSSSSETVSTENGNTHTRNSSLEETRPIEEEYNEELAMWEVAKREGYAASRIAQYDSPVKAPVVLEVADVGGALASDSVQHEAKSDVEESADVLVGEEFEEAREAEEKVNVAEDQGDASSEEAPLPLPFTMFEEETPFDESQPRIEDVENAAETSSVREAEKEIEVAENFAGGSSEEVLPLPLPPHHDEKEAPQGEAQKGEPETIENAIKASSDDFVAHTSLYLLVVAIIVAFLWPFAG